MHILKTMMLTASLAVSACASAQRDPAAALMSGIACEAVSEDMPIFMWLNVQSVEAGNSIEIYALTSEYPGSYNQLEPACIGDIQLSAEGIATISRDEAGTPTLTVEPALTGSADLTVSASYNGTEIMEGRISAYNSADLPLVGLWRQDREACPGNALEELLFRANGTFAATWTPFEVYNDYWGNYRFDPATGELSLEVTGSNYLPEDLRSGRVRLEGDVLQLDTASFGQNRAGVVCEGLLARG
jgi:hypothetical protein